MIYGSAVPNLTGTVTGFVSGEALETATSGTPVFSTDATPASSVGSYAVNGSGLTANLGNYLFVQADVNAAALTVTPAPLTVTADVKSKTYGDYGFAEPALTYQITSGSLVNGDSFSGALTRVAGENVGSYPIQQGTLALSSNYSLTFVGANLTINRRPVEVTADPKTKFYGDADPALTYQVTSGSLAFSDAFAGGLTRAAGETVGTHAIQRGTLTLSGNYDLTYVGANLTIATRPTAVAVYRASTQTFHIDRNANGRWDGPSVDKAVVFGIAGDVPLAGDWSGSGTTKIGVYRPGNRTFYLDLNGNGKWDGPTSDRQYTFGTTGDTPICGDWDGDGKFEIGIYRPSNQFFCLDLNGNGQWDPGTDAQYQFGSAGDVPISGDWDGDGKFEIGVYRPSTRTFCLDLNGNGRWDGPTVDGSHIFGTAGDTAVVGSWGGSTRTKVGVFRSGTQTFCLDLNGNGQWDGPTIDASFAFGISTDKPLAGRWA